MGLSLEMHGQCRLNLLTLRVFSSEYRPLVQNHSLASDRYCRVCYLHFWVIFSFLIHIQGSTASLLGKSGLESRTKLKYSPGKNGWWGHIQLALQLSFCTWLQQNPLNTGKYCLLCKMELHLSRAWEKSGVSMGSPSAIQHFLDIKTPLLIHESWFTQVLKSDPTSIPWIIRDRGVTAGARCVLIRCWWHCWFGFFDFIGAIR